MLMRFFLWLALIISVRGLVFLGECLVILLPRQQVLPRHVLHLSDIFTHGVWKLPHAVWMFSIKDNERHNLHTFPESFEEKQHLSCRYREKISPWQGTEVEA